MKGYQFSSREIKELARRFDGIYFPPNTEISQPIYFIEVQFQEKIDFWWRFITEIFVYLGQYQPENDWVAVALFAQKSIDSGLPYQHQCLINAGKIKVIYLDELKITEDSSVGIDLMALTVSQESEAINIAQKAYQKTQKWSNFPQPNKIVELIETALIYKLKNLTREEIEAIFTYDDLKDTRYFQQVAEENKQKGLQQGEIKGKLKTVPLLIQLGMTIEEIADRLELPLESVRNASNPQSN